MRPISLTVGALAALLALPGLALSQAAQSNIRGKVQSVEGQTITVKTREGKTLKVKEGDNFGVLGVVKAKLSDIKQGDFVGVAAAPGKNGMLRAQEVLIFPEAARGTGEGHYPWDLRGKGDTMTNATVEGVATGKAKDRVLTLKYKDGEKQIDVPPNVPIVTFQPADPSLLKKGAAVFLRAPIGPDGTVVAQRIIAEQNGVKPPM